MSGRLGESTFCVYPFMKTTLFKDTGKLDLAGIQYSFYVSKKKDPTQSCTLGKSVHIVCDMECSHYIFVCLLYKLFSNLTAKAGSNF